MFGQLTRLAVGVAVAALTTAAVANVGHAQLRCEPEKVAQKYPEYAGKTVKVAATPTYPPFTYSDPKDLEKMTGLEVEIAEAALSCAGLKFEYVKGPWSGLLPTLFSGATDVMIGNVAYRPDRAEKADFILFMRNGQSVVVPKGNPNKIAGLTDLCGRTTAQSVGGSSFLEMEKQSKLCVERGKPAITIQAAVDQEAAYRQLSNGRIDMMMDGAASAAARVTSDTAKDMEVAFTITTDIPAGPAVRKGNDSIAKVLADGMKVQEADGSLKKLMAKYGLPTDLLIPVEVRR